MDGVELSMYGVLDEAGDVGHAEGSSRYLVVAIVVVSNVNVLRKAVARVRKSIHKRRRDIPEFKAFKTDPRLTRRLLHNLAQLDCEIIAMVIEKQPRKAPDDTEDLYRRVCACAVRQCLERHPQLSLYVDRRYTKPALREKWNRVVLEKLGDLQRVILSIEHSASEEEPALQVADAVAWSLFQRYERGDDSFYRLIQGRIAVEEFQRAK